METRSGIPLLNNGRHWTLCVLASFLFCVILVLYFNYNHHGPSLSALKSVWITPMTAMSEALTTTGSDSPSTSIIGIMTTGKNTSKDLASDPTRHSKETRKKMEIILVTKNKSKDLASEDNDHGTSPSALEITEKSTLSDDFTIDIYNAPGDGIIERLKIAQTREKCDIFNGRWIYDPKMHPLYKLPNCPFLSKQVTCRKNGRPDHDFEQWRWEARDCEIPRFNGTDMLERLRGKRVIIVGDSLNRNMWESLACLLYSAIPSKRVEVNAGGGGCKIFKATDYNCTVEFYWSPFLVQLLDKPRRILKLDTPHVTARKWQGANIMVFNTGHWWTHTGKMQVWDALEHGGNLLDNLPLERAFQKAMKAWADWIDQNVDPTETTVFFRTISPEHKGNQWCYNQTQPMKEETYEDSFPKPITEIVEKTIREMKTPVKYLNITKLSQSRIDAHPTVYTTKGAKLLNEEQRKLPKLYADCSHWCLPGLPDTWNSLLYASIILKASRDIV